MIFVFGATVSTVQEREAAAEVWADRILGPHLDLVCALREAR